MTQFRREAGRGLAAWLLAVALALGCQGGRESETGQRLFETPEAATEALFAAIERDAVDEILAILGPGHEENLVTADWDADREIRQRIAAAARETLELVELRDGELEIVVGAEEYPLAIPLVREDDAWRYDTEEGIEVLLDRRVGRNELSAIEILHAYVDAQIDYARADRDDDGVGEYAQRLASTEGERDGLFWEAGPDEAQSPFGPLVKGAERYLDTLEPGDPLRGYYFRILTRQGENPPGGAYDYVINGNMIAGFGLVAYPAEYGNTGVMTFVVNHRGRIHQKDLGESTGLDTYDPDDSWTEVTD